MFISLQWRESIRDKGCMPSSYIDDISNELKSEDNDTFVEAINTLHYVFESEINKCDFKEKPPYLLNGDELISKLIDIFEYFIEQIVKNNNEANIDQNAEFLIKSLHILLCIGKIGQVSVLIHSYRMLLILFKKYDKKVHFTHLKASVLQLKDKWKLSKNISKYVDNDLWFNDDLLNDTCEYGIGSIILKVLSIFFLSGPSSYLQFKDTPIFPVTSVGIGNKGYGWSAWIRLDSINDDTTNIFSFMSESGKGIQCQLYNNLIGFKALPSSSEKVTLNSLHLRAAHWYLIVVSHTPPEGRDKKSKLRVYVNGFTTDKLVLNITYPNLQVTQSLQCTVGGFHGCMADFNIYNTPPNLRHVVKLFSLGYNIVDEPCIFNLNKYLNIAFMSSRYFFKSSPEFNQRVDLPAVYSQSVINSAEEVCLPEGLTIFEHNDRRLQQNIIHYTNKIEQQRNCNASHTTKIKGLRTCVRPRNRTYFIESGGLHMLFLLVSPMLQGRNFNNSHEVSALFDLLSVLVTESSASIAQLLSFGPKSLRYFILETLSLNMKTSELIKSMKRFLWTIHKADFTVTKRHFTSLLVNLFGDFSMWLNVDLDCQLEVANMILYFVRENSDCLIDYNKKNIKLQLNQDCLSAQVILDGIRIWRPLLFKESNNKSEIDISVPIVLLDCIYELSIKSKLPVQEMDSLVTFIEDCYNPKFTAQILQLLLRLGEVLPNQVYGFLHSEFGDFRTYMKLLQVPDEEVRLLSLKIIGRFLNFRNKEPYQSMKEKQQRILFFSDISHTISRRLSVFPVTKQLYITMLEVACGRESGPDISDIISLDDNDYLLHPHILRELMELVVDDKNNETLHERLMVDILTLLKLSGSKTNLKLFTTRFFWQKHLIQFINNNNKPVNQLIVHILQTTLYYELCNVNRGWVSFDQMLWCLSKLNNNTTTTSTNNNTDNDNNTDNNNNTNSNNNTDSDNNSDSVNKKNIDHNDNVLYNHQLAINVFVQLIHRIHRDSLPTDSKLLSIFNANFEPTVKLIEYLLYHDEDRSFVYLTEISSNDLSTNNIDVNMFMKREPNEEEIDLQLSLLKMITNPQLYPLPAMRQDVLRILFRFLFVIIPLESCDSLFEQAIKATSTIFMQRIQTRHDKNFRLIKIVIGLLKNLMEHYIRLQQQLSRVDIIKRLMHQILTRWGTDILNTNNDELLSPMNKVSTPVIEGHEVLFENSLENINEEKVNVDVTNANDKNKMDEKQNKTSNSKAESVLSPVKKKATSIFAFIRSKVKDVPQPTKPKEQRRTSFTVSEVENSLLGIYQSDLGLADVFKTLIDKDILFRQRMKERINRIHQSILAYTEKQDERLAVRAKQFESILKERKKSTIVRQTKENARLSRLSIVLTKKMRAGISGDKSAYELLRQGFKRYYTETCLRDKQGHFWKLDQTEGHYRMRKFLRLNLKGSTHPEATQQKRLSMSLNNNSILNEEQDVTLLPGAKLAVARRDSSVDLNAELDNNSNNNENEEEKSISIDNDNDDDNDDDEKTEISLVEMDENDTEYDIDLPQASIPNKDESALHDVEAVLIMATRKLSGRLRVTRSVITFKGHQIHHDATPTTNSMSSIVVSPTSNSNENTNDNINENHGENKNKNDILSTYTNASISSDREKVYTWPVRGIRQILPRRYLFRPTALEIFMKNFTNYFIHFPEKNQRNRILKTMCQLVRVPYELSPIKRLKYTGITQRWQAREISNFEYLMLLNTLAGRSYNDMTQYPVFPWVITDYTSNTLNLEDPSIYRDLSKPIGALNDDRWQVFEERFEGFQDDTIPPFHYGSHYSSAGIALYYLLRLEPFSTLGIRLQGGTFDLPDRLFSSIAGAWHLSYTNISDVKELIPEFYYLPEFLMNSNNFDFGKRQTTSEQVGHVELPPWANGSPDEFIRLHRQALESEYVSQHLHEWIDLIFGFKQQGEAALNARNVFFYLTYANNVDIDAIKDPKIRESTEAQIAHFGQTPEQLFIEPHPSRYPVEQCNISKINFDQDNVNNNTDTNNNNDNNFIHHLVNKLPYSPCFIKIRPTVSNAIAVVPYLNVYSMSLINNTSGSTSSASAYQSESLVMKEMPSQICSHWIENTLIKDRRLVVTITKNGKFIFSGGYIDRSFKCHVITNDDKLVELSSMVKHGTPICCLSISECQQYVITGSLDGQVMIWFVRTRHHDWRQPPLHFPPTAAASYIIHKESVVDVAISSRAGLATSMSSLECVLYHLRRGRVLRIIKLEEPTLKMCLSREGDLLFSSLDQLTRYTINGRKLFSIETDREITVMMYTPKGEYAVIGDKNGNIVFCNTHNLDVVAEFHAPKGINSSVQCIDIDSNEECLLVGYESGEIYAFKIPNTFRKASFMEVAIEAAKDTYDSTGLNKAREMFGKWWKGSS